MATKTKSSSSSDAKKLSSILKSAGIKNAKTGGSISASTISKYSSSKSSSSSSSKSISSSQTPTPAPTPTPTKSTYDILAPYITAGREEEAKAIIAGGGSKTPTPTPTVTKPSTYTGSSLVDYLKSTGQGTAASSWNSPERQALATQAGITNYTGTAAQNTQLLNTLRSGSTGATPTPTTPTPTPVVDVASSLPVREELPEKPLLKPLESQTYADFKEEIEQYSPKAPETPQLADIYTQERQKLGISALEDEITNYDAEKAELLAEMDAFKRQESVGQSASFAAGRVSAGAQNVQDKIDALERSQAIAINKLNTKNSFLENLIKFTKDDYSTANSNYQFEFNKNLQVQQMFSNKQDKVVDDARATLTTFNNILSTSGMSYNDMSPAMQSQMNVLEMQAGMPIGTMELYARSKPKSNMISQGEGVDSAGNKSVWILSSNPDDPNGQPIMSTMPTGLKSGSSDSGGAKLSLADAKKYGLPTSLVGMTESEIGDQLASSKAPSWFKEKLETEGQFSATPQLLQTEWDNFRASAMTSRSL